MTDVQLHAPVPAPPKYIAIGMNSRDHRNDINVRWLMREPKLIRIAAGYLLAHPHPKQPFFFAKATSSIVGPTDPIVLPPHSDQVDWEGELAVIIGAVLHEATVETSQRGIAGYLIANDVSVRDWQTDNPTASALAKGYPTHGPLGRGLPPPMSSTPPPHSCAPTSTASCANTDAPTNSSCPPPTSSADSARFAYCNPATSSPAAHSPEPMAQRTLSAARRPGARRNRRTGRFGQPGHRLQLARAHAPRPHCWVCWIV